MQKYVLFFTLLLSLILSGSVIGLAQEAPREHRPQAGATQPESPANEKPNSAGEGDEVKNAPSIQALARKTGMSTERAYWVSVLVNFGLVVVIIVILMRKNLPGMFKARNESIYSRMEEARKSSEEARRRLTEVEGRLSRLDAEITEMRREAEDNARSEEKRLQEEAEQEGRRIVASAEQEITAASGAARRELRAYAAELAVDLAEKKIRIGRETDQTLVREFTDQLGKDGK
ncbi:MAG TPA: ATP synthase F0 subunit B [Candidatus Limnocylindrales bacterium]|jgi:F-type H+-transporting ATPase subunit b|nr:ATP synthase F0 subunit B [Candidatus Limnocylindrales bacterium]